MKKTITILAIVMLISFIASAILVGIQLQNMESLQIKIVDVSEEKEIEISEKTNCIEIDTIIVDEVNVMHTDEENIRVELTGSYTTVMDRKVKLYTDKRTHNIKISVKQEGLLRYVQFGDYTNELVLNVYIPRTYEETLDIDVFCRVLNIDKSIENSNINLYD